ncbi:hypothetical protein [Pseudomonas sp. R16(2017)]|nr:hypothetical protein [Pseudomonas sp. R16(2017)]
MKLTYWALAALLVVALAAYSVVRDSSGVCQVPHSITYRVFR